jgi:transposase
MKLRLGIDVACRAANQASLADETGEFAWSGWRFKATPAELEELWAKLPEGAEEVVVVMEPTRNAWVPLAAWLQAKGAKVVLVAPEQSADLREYYAKHTKTDRLDSKMLARLPLLHPEGLATIDDLGPADALKRAVRRRSKLVKARTACHLRLDALLELLGPTYGEVLGAGSYGKAALTVLGRYADPRALKKLGRRRLADLLTKASRGAWGTDKADELLAAADDAISLWDSGGMDFAELAADIASEVRVLASIDDEIDRAESRIDPLYAAADPEGIVRSAPGVASTLAAGILGRFGDMGRFANLGGARSFTGLVPKIDQSGNSFGHGGPTKSGDPGLREALYMAADHARRVDPTLAARYYRLVVDCGKHHDSALCHLAAVLATRIAACWRKGERYVLRDVDGREITDAEGRVIVAERYKIPEEVRRAAVGRTGPRRSSSGRTGAVRSRPGRPLRRPARPPLTLPTTEQRETIAAMSSPASPTADPRATSLNPDRIPLRNDGVTIACLICGRPFLPSGRRRYCSDACRQAAHRRRHSPGPEPALPPPRRPRREWTVYECPNCEQRLFGSRRCEDCNVFARKLGRGGPCPHCEEPVLLTDLGCAP